jgi:sugar diacid utilization regulator
MGSAARVQRIADSIGKALEARPVRVISGLRDNLMTVVISGTRRVSGWTAPQSRLADQVEHELLKLGPSVLIGLSADQPSTSHIPRGLNEARIAFELSSVAARVVQFSKLPIRRLLLHVGGDQVKAALPAWTEEFLSANSKSHGKLVATLRAYAASDMSVLKAARALDVHPNTIYSRMGRIEKLTGMDAQRFDALNELLLAAELSG